MKNMIMCEERFVQVFFRQFVREGQYLEVGIGRCRRELGLQDVVLTFLESFEIQG